MSISTTTTRTATLLGCLALGACGGGEPSLGFDSSLQAPLGPGEGYSLLRTFDSLHEIDHIAVSDDYLFFSSPWHGLYRLPKYGGKMDDVDVDAHAVVGGVVSNGSEVFWIRSTFGAGDVPHNKLERRSATGGPVTVMKDGGFNTVSTNYTQNMLLDTTNVYVLDEAVIWAFPLLGGAPTSITYADSTMPPPAAFPRWAPDYPSMYLSECFGSSSPCSLLKADVPTDTIQSLLPLDRASQDTVAAVDENNIYLVKNQRVSSISKADLTITDLYVPEPGEGVEWFLLVDANNVSFISGGTAGLQLRSVPKTGGPAPAIGWGAQLDGGIWQIAQDSEFLFVLAGPRTSVTGQMSWNDILMFPRVPATTN